MSAKISARLQFAEAKDLWQTSVKFVQKYAKGPEPNAESVKAYLDCVPDAEFKEALQFEGKYNSKIKPRGWRTDVSKLFTIAFLAWQAHQVTDAAEITLAKKE